MKYFIYLFIFICWSCREEVPWRIEVLRSQVDRKFLGSCQVDSLISTTQNLTPLEHYAFVCYVLRFCNSNGTPEQMEYYREKLRELPFPVVKNKESGFLLMQQFAYGGISSQDIDVKMLSKLLFDMENRFNFTPEEKCRYLSLKSGIYIYSFNEFGTGTSIADEAAALARKNGLANKHLFHIYEMQRRCCIRFRDWEKAVELANELLDTTKNYQIDLNVRRKLYTDLVNSYYKQKEYHKAYDSWLKSGKSKMYFMVLADILLNTNRISEALDYLEEQKKEYSLRFKENPKALHINLGYVAWSQANSYLLQGDTNRYEHFLHEALCYFDLVPQAEIRDGALSEAYARRLWAHGRRREAISRMEMLTRLLANRKYNVVDVEGNFPDRFRRLQLLADYYIETERLADACRQLKLCDSLKKVHAKVILWEEECKVSNRVYVQELSHNLERRTLDFLRERQEKLLVVVLFGCMMILSVVLGWLYFRRQKELNAIYALQKKTERLESILWENPPAENSNDLPADKQLYLRLQKQMYEQKLFLKPDFSRNDLCCLAGSNRMYVSTSINKYAEMNLNQWINKARINHAIGLIHSGESRLQILAKSSGFSSSSAFYRNFKQLTLLTPTQYIERERKSAASAKDEAVESLSSCGSD